MRTPHSPLPGRLLVLTAACLFAAIACAKPWWVAGNAANGHDFLPPEVAFRVAAHADGARVDVRWIIANGYYLYRSKFEVSAESPGLELGRPAFPPGTVLTDPYFGNQVVYTQQVDLSMPYTRADAGAHPLQIRVTYQGCAVAGLCYPPIVQVLFPDAPAAPVPKQAHPAEAVGILGGIALFFLTGWSFRRTRRLALPAP